MPQGADRERVITLLKPWELGLISGSLKQAKRSAPAEDHDEAPPRRKRGKTQDQES